MCCLLKIEMSARVEHLVVVNKDESALENLLKNIVEEARNSDVELLERLESTFDQTVNYNCY